MEETIAVGRKYGYCKEVLVLQGSMSNPKKYGYCKEVHLLQESADVNEVSIIFEQNRPIFIYELVLKSFFLF